MTRTRVVGVGLALAGLIVVGCSSSKINNTAAGGSNNTTATTAKSTGGGSGAKNTNDLSAIQASVQGLKNATFKASYTATDSSGKQTTTTFEQKGAKSVFASGDGNSFINDGTTTYLCSAGSSSDSSTTAAPTCQNLGTAGNPLASVIGLYNGTTLLPLLQGLQAQVAAKAAGVSVSYTKETFAGQSSKCATWSYQGQSAKWCVTDSGIIAYYGGSGTGGSGSFQLSSYSSNPSDDDFKVPAGATTVTLPSGISIPSIPSSTP